jgi:hypothetical protein
MEICYSSCLDPEVMPSQKPFGQSNRVQFLKIGSDAKSAPNTNRRAEASGENSPGAKALTLAVNERPRCLPRT